MKNIMFVVVCILMLSWRVDCDDVQDAQEEVEKELAKCISFFGASDDDAKAIENLNFTTGSQKCIVYCKFQLLEFMTGLEVNAEKLLTMHKRLRANQESVLKKAESNVNTCVGKGNALKSTKDPCEMAAEIYTCMEKLIQEELDE